MMLAMCLSYPAQAQFNRLVGGIKKKVSSSAQSAAATASGKTYFVSPAGSPRGDGSQAKPLKDIQRAITLAQNGDVIRVAEGDYLGTLDQGFIEIQNKYISVIGGYSPDFSEHNPAKYRTTIRPGAAQAGTCGSKGTIHILAKGNPQATVVIDGFVLDRGQINVYCKPIPENPVTSTPNANFETGRIVFPGESPSAVMGTFTVKEPLIRGEIEGNIIIRNCVFLNSGNYAIMAAIRPVGKMEVYNNIFVANVFAACQVTGNSISQDKCSLDFHHNTVLFSWCRTKVMEDMGYGLRFMTGINTRAYNNIFGCSNLGALDRGYVDSNKAIEEKRETSAFNNYFFMNKSDIVLPSGGGKWLMVAAERFEEVMQLKEYEGNKQLPASETAFVEAINQDYLGAFTTISCKNTSNYDPNSAANFVNRAFGMNQQGSETVRPSMYGNRYPYEDAFKLWGKVKGYGAQIPE